MSQLTHFNQDGEAHMVDVGAKDETHRIAVVEGRIRMQPETLQMILAGSHKKGDVLAAKKTSDLVPLCHPLAITKVGLDLTSLEDGIHCRSQVETRGRTGVEMEALCAAQVALLTIYDMCKAVDRGMIIDNIRLMEKQGGKSGHWKRE